MYSSIMVPTDLAHADTLDKAISTAADLAKLYDAKLYLVGVTDVAPSAAAHSPQEFDAKMEAFAKAKSDETGVAMTGLTVVSHDPAIELDDKLAKTAAKLGVDLVVMATHLPRFSDLLFSSNAGWMASHADISVFVVR
jgi:nucleotide-binding universal stress UspA family protein